MMQAILGSGGAIGVELAKALKEYTSEIRLVSRNPKKVNHSDMLHPADLLDTAEVDRAVEGDAGIDSESGCRSEETVGRED